MLKPTKWINGNGRAGYQPTLDDGRRAWYTAPDMEWAIWTHNERTYRWPCICFDVESANRVAERFLWEEREDDWLEVSSDG